MPAQAAISRRLENDMSLPHQMPPAIHARPVAVTEEQPRKPVRAPPPLWAGAALFVLGFLAVPSVKWGFGRLQGFIAGHAQHQRVYGGQP
jgi:hypothetical protein